MRFSISLIGGLLPLLSVVGVGAERIYTIKNKCPATIKVYSGGHPRGTIPTGRSITKSFPDNWDGFIYTNANGGTVKGSKTTKAGFYGEVSSGSVSADNIPYSLLLLDRLLLHRKRSQTIQRRSQHHSQSHQSTFTNFSFVVKPSSGHFL